MELPDWVRFQGQGNPDSPDVTIFRYGFVYPWWWILLQEHQL